MTALLKKLVLGLLAIGAAFTANAFSLSGPLAPWQNARLGYIPPGDPGWIASLGVMNLGEEYRWNVPKVYYGFTSDFFNYFGQRGVQEVERAFQILNALPPASQMRLEDYPTRSMRINHRAQSLNLVDLHTIALTDLLQTMGLATPSRYVYTLRQRWISPGGAPTNFYVIKRNFDPVTLAPSSYINGRLWTYDSIFDGDTASDVNRRPVDPLDLAGVLYSPVADNFTGAVLGGFWTGLTRDDIGGLRYIYRNINRNVENAPPGATGSTGVPWGSPNGNLLVDTVLRGGVEKIEFIRVDYDSIIGGFMVPFTNRYSETIYTNSQPQTQYAQQAMTVPNILYDAADITGDDGGTRPLVRVGYSPWDNNNDINDTQGEVNLGPGVVPSFGTDTTFVFTYNTVGPTLWNIWPNSLDELSATQEPLWGTFDGSTNEPIVYPNIVSLEELEFLLLQAQ